MSKKLKDLVAGIDLHSNNLVIGIMNQDGRRVKHGKLPCELKGVRRWLAAYKKRLRAVAVESTYNWYWLVDGLVDAGYPVKLANPAQMEQYSGLKHGDDRSDAFFLAELLRLDILPTGHIYNADLRPVRDLLRRRLSLVHQRTALLLSFKSLYTRTTGAALNLGRVKSMSVEQTSELYEHPANQLIAQVQKQHIEYLDQSIDRIEKVVLKCARQLPYYEKLKTLPGVGVILGLTITMEVGDIGRFPSAGDFASYCRTVDARRMSNGKVKGANNQKCGNKYLAWAWVEAANFAKRYQEDCRRWFDRKAAKRGSVLATKALACKLAKAGWYLMSQECDYEPGRIFPEQAMKEAA